MRISIRLNSGDCVAMIRLIQNRHPAIAYLYGRNTGSKYNRFIVLHTGYVQPLGELLRDGTLDLSVTC